MIFFLKKQIVQLLHFFISRFDTILEGIDQISKSEVYRLFAFLTTKKGRGESRQPEHYTG